MTHVTYLGESLIPAKFVQLAGQLTVGGMSTRSFDAVRDVCTMHLHTETGGVFVQRGEDHFFLAPIVIQCVELVGQISHEEEAPPSYMAIHMNDTSIPQDVKDEVHAEAVAKGAANLADEVLAELQGDDTPKPKSRASRRKN